MNYYYVDEETGQFLNKTLTNFASTVKDIGSATSKTQAKKVIKEQTFCESIKIVSDDNLAQAGYSGISEAFNAYNNTFGFTSTVFDITQVANVDTITEVLSFCESVSDSRADWQNKLDRANVEQQDLLHVLEFYDLSEEDYARVAKQLHDIRQVRRKAQVMVDIAREIDSVFQKRSTKARCSEALKNICSRVYTPRVYFDLFKEMNEKYGSEANSRAKDSSCIGKEEK